MEKKSWKLRIYKQKGLDKGNLDHEEFFGSKEDMDCRYKSLFNYKAFALNPTAYEKVEVNGRDEWRRLEGY